eukprot:scaffold33472_cov101-Isochrysis_galbana.AAC.1
MRRRVLPAQPIACTSAARPDSGVPNDRPTCAQTVSESFGKLWLTRPAKHRNAPNLFLGKLRFHGRIKCVKSPSESKGLNNTHSRHQIVNSINTCCIHHLDFPHHSGRARGTRARPPIRPTFGPSCNLPPLQRPRPAPAPATESFFHLIGASGAPAPPHPGELSSIH